MKIAYKAFAFTMVLVLFILVCSYGILYFWLPSFYRNQIVKDIEGKTDVLMTNLRQTTSKDDRQAILNQFLMDYEVQPILTSDDENIYAIPVVINDLSSLSQYPGTEIGNGYIEYNLVIDPSDVYIVNREINIDGSIYKLSITVPLKPVGKTVNVIAGMIPYLLLFSIVICAVATLFYSRVITKPIVLISETTHKMKELDAKTYSPVSSKDEIGELSANLNAMYQQYLDNIQQLSAEMERVSELEKSRAQFMQAASHELKTPIASLRGIVEGMIDRVGVYKDRDSFLMECNRLLIDMENLTKKIIAAAADGLDIQQTETVNLSELTQQILFAIQPLSEQKGIHLISEVTQGVFIASSKIPLEQMISNIMTNAVLYAEEPFEVKITLANHTGLKLTIYNSCTPLSDDEIKRVFEPFYRLERSKVKEIEGSGLGLTIVTQLAEALRLEVSFTAVTDGMCFTILFQ